MALLEQRYDLRLNGIDALSIRCGNHEHADVRRLAGQPLHRGRVGNDDRVVLILSEPALPARAHGSDYRERNAAHRDGFSNR